MNNTPYAGSAGQRPSAAAGGGGAPLLQPLDPEWEQLDAVMQQPLLGPSDAVSRPPSGQRPATWQQRQQQRMAPARATDQQAQRFGGMPSRAAAGPWDAYNGAAEEEELGMEQVAARPHQSRGVPPHMQGRPPAGAAATSRVLRPGGVVGRGAAAPAAGGGFNDWEENELLLLEEPMDPYQGLRSLATPAGGTSRRGGAGAGQGMGLGTGRQPAPGTPSVLGAVSRSQQDGSERIMGAFMAHRQPNKQLGYRRQGNSRQTQLYWRG